MKIDYFYKLEDGVDGVLYCDNEPSILIEDFVVHFSEINKFKQILINQGINRQEERIRIESFVIDKSDAIRLKENKEFKCFFNGQVVEYEEDKEVIYISTMQFDCVSFNVNDWVEKESDGKIEIQMPLMIIHKRGKCGITYDASRD